MKQIIGLSLLLVFIVTMAIGWIVVWALSEHYVVFWKIVDGVRGYLLDTYVRGKVI